MNLRPKTAECNLALWLKTMDNNSYLRCKISRLNFKYWPQIQGLKTLQRRGTRSSSATLTAMRWHVSMCMTHKMDPLRIVLQPKIHLHNWPRQLLMLVCNIARWLKISKPNISRQRKNLEIKVLQKHVRLVSKAL